MVFISCSTRTQLLIFLTRLCEPRYPTTVANYVTARNRKRYLPRARRVLTTAPWELVLTQMIITHYNFMWLAFLLLAQLVKISVFDSQGIHLRYQMTTSLENRKTLLIYELRFYLHLLKNNLNFLFLLQMQQPESQFQDITRDYSHSHHSTSSISNLFLDINDYYHYYSSSF